MDMIEYQKLELALHEAAHNYFRNPMGRYNGVAWIDVLKHAAMMYGAFVDKDRK